MDAIFRVVLHQARTKMVISAGFGPISTWNAFGFAVTLKRAIRLGIARDLVLVLQHWWPTAFRLGFFTTLPSTRLQVVASPRPRRTDP